MILKGKLYDYLKFLAQIVLPALGTLYFALAAIWGLPAAEQVVGTIVVIDTFLGVILGISQAQYSNNPARYGGAIQVLNTPHGGKTFTLELNQSVDDLLKLEEQKEILFEVLPPK